MKVYVWTKWDMRSKEPGGREPKCIFIGEIACAPSIGEYVVCREGFGAEAVYNVIHDLQSGEVEITVNTDDHADSYGPCLFRETIVKA